MTKWTVYDYRLAFEEGWGIFDSDERGIEIERIDEAERFSCDDEALAWVAAHATNGSEFHQRALRYVAAWR